MSDLIEKVARAISEGDWDQAPDGRAGQRLMQNRDGTFRDINMPSRDEYCDTARAAILAVLEHYSEAGNVSDAMAEGFGEKYMLGGVTVGQVISAAMRAELERLKGEGK